MPENPITFTSAVGLGYLRCNKQDAFRENMSPMAFRPILKILNIVLVMEKMTNLVQMHDERKSEKVQHM